MPFYDDAPRGKKRKNYANEGSWEDEGTHYRGARRFGPDGQNDAPRRSEGYRDGHASYAGARDNRRPDRPTNRRDDRRPAPRRDDREPQWGSQPQWDSRPQGSRPQRDSKPPRREDRPPRYAGERRPRPMGEDVCPPRRPELAPPPPRPVSYMDSEYRPEPPVREEPPVYENLLAGRNPIREALKSGRDLEKLLVQKGELSGSAREIVQMAKAAHIPVQEVEKSRLDEITRHHQGMLAFASAYQYSTVEAMLDEAAERGEAPFLVLLDGITDPHNLGAIIRSAECAGAHGVIVPERRSVGLTPAAVKASAGAVEHMKVARVTNLNRTIDELKEHGVWLYAVTMEGQDYEKTDFKGGVALVIGSEGEGISRLTLEHCDVAVSLPMAGHIDSLNASVAAGVMMYRVLSSRRS